MGLVPDAETNIISNKKKTNAKKYTGFEEPGECGGMVSSLVSAFSAGWAKVTSLLLRLGKHNCELPSNGSIVVEQSGVTCAKQGSVFVNG